jgi:hypothetical protein
MLERKRVKKKFCFQDPLPEILISAPGYHKNMWERNTIFINFESERKCLFVSINIMFILFTFN